MEERGDEEEKRDRGHFFTVPLLTDTVISNWEMSEWSHTLHIPNT